uniref:PX domain-containing protein n=1 Tax=Mucochytrium quahogii TaxID=96639 RepID=A0A7S2W5H8_9STRA|mmetsp:Transcript_19228/g.31561  ORF Transcript_19228/g.31561 Transcript_19228/m.31561 type:complete len:377 (+) Transcript_19228:301-1431(+)
MVGARDEEKLCRVQSLKGLWEMYSVESTTCVKDIKCPVGLLDETVQDIQVNGSQLVFSSLNGKSLELDLERENKNKVKCVCPIQGSPLRLEYEGEQGKIIDERRVFRRGTRLEQRLSIVADSKKAVVERRYFKRKDCHGSEQTRHDHQKVKLLAYLLASQVPLMMLVPARVWGSFLCGFHVVALILILLWSPKTDSRSPTSRQVPPTSALEDSKVESLEPAKPASKPIVRKNDCYVSISQVRKRRKGLTTYSEYQFVVKAFRKDGTKKEWTLWKRYTSILEFHSRLQELLETEQSKHSIFTRVVPALPRRSRSHRLLLRARSQKSYQDVLRRRMAGLDEFLVRVLGPDSDRETRQVAIGDNTVRKFLQLDDYYGEM